jgi:hypothetical protein
MGQKLWIWRSLSTSLEHRNHSADIRKVPLVMPNRVDQKVLEQFCWLLGIPQGTFRSPPLFVLELSIRAQFWKLLLLAINNFSGSFKIPERRNMKNYQQKRGKMKKFHVFETLHEFLFNYQIFHVLLV